MISLAAALFVVNTLVHKPVPEPTYPECSPATTAGELCRWPKNYQRITLKHAQIAEWQFKASILFHPLSEGWNYTDGEVTLFLRFRPESTNDPQFIQMYGASESLFVDKPERQLDEK